jgi:hypothetical protein
MQNSTILYPYPLNVLSDSYTDDSEKDICVVHRSLWESWVHQQTTEVLLASIKQDETETILCVDTYHTHSPDIIYLPRRVMGTMNLNTFVEINVVQTLPPIATKIELQPIDSAIYHTDIPSAVSAYLSHWNVLSEHTMLSVPIPELGDYVVEIFVKKTEPEKTVLLRGEVPFEIVESPFTIPEFQTDAIVHSPQIQPQRPSTPVPEDISQFLPSYSQSNQNLQNIQTQSAQTQAQTQVQTTFTPFSGTGYRLGK